MFRVTGETDPAQRPELPRWLVAGAGAVGLFAVALTILLIIGSSASTAGHPSLAQFSLNGTETPSGNLSPCDAAVDGEGNVYASDPVNSEIVIFDGEGSYAGAISNSKRPCAVAVDSRGNVYVTEEDAGTVVRYEPSDYPFKGAPRYGAPETIDASGGARGIAVDPFDDRLYVAKGGSVDVFNADGSRGQNEMQHVYPFEATGGTFQLRFEHGETPPIPFDATHAEVEAALDLIGSVGPDGVSVEDGPNGERDHLVVFRRDFERTNVEPITANPAKLSGGHAVRLLIEGVTEGFDGRIGEGLFSDASDIAVHTYGDATRHLFVADSAGPAADRVYVFAGSSVKTLDLEATVDGSDTPDGSLGFAGGGSLAVDQQTGHLYVHDAEHSAVDEFEAGGDYVMQIQHDSLEGEEPAGIAVDRSGGSRDGTVYVSTGSAGDVLAFGPASVPRHPRVAGLGGDFEESCGIAVDSHGDVYVAGGTTIAVYDPDGDEITAIEEPDRPCDLALDSEGNIYAVTRGGIREGDEEVRLYRPDSYPPSPGTEYRPPKTVFTYTGLEWWVGVNPANDHLLTNLNSGVASDEFRLVEFDSARNGSDAISEDQIGKGVLRGIESFGGGLDVCGETGDIYVAGRGETGWRVYILDRTGTERLVAIDGSGSRRGPFLAHSLGIAVDQSNCHVFMADSGRPVEEYEPSGAFVTDFGPELSLGDVAVDNGSFSPNRGNVYAASGEEWLAFGPLGYESP